MSKIKISGDFRARLSDKLMDLGNYTAVGLVIGQLIADKPISQDLLIGGIIGTGVFYLAGYIVST